MKKTSTLLFIMLACATSLMAQTVYFAGKLTGSAEVPANASSAEGVVIVKYDVSANTLDLVGSFQGLSTDVTAAHIHLGEVGVAGGVIFPLTTTGTTWGTLSQGAAPLTLTETQEANLLNGQYYVNVHTATNPGGEIRAQLVQTTTGNSVFYSATFSGSQEVPPNASAGTGSVYVLIDTVENKVWATGSFSGLGSNTTAGHLHLGAAGTVGPVLIPFNIVTGGTAGVFSAAEVSVTAANVTSIVNGLLYANIHSDNFPGGEIRAQLTEDMLLPVTLMSFSGISNQQVINLVWQSAYEESLKDYIVQELNESNNKWMDKGVILPANGANTNNTYKFTDKPSTFGNAVFYRLKITGLNGDISYSSVIKVDLATGAAMFKLLSNPVIGGRLNYQISGYNFQRPAVAMVKDMAGKTLRQSNTVQEGFNSMEVGNLPRGTYKLVIVVDNKIVQASFVR